MSPDQYQQILSYDDLSNSFLDGLSSPDEAYKDYLQWRTRVISADPQSEVRQWKLSMDDFKCYILSLKSAEEREMDLDDDAIRDRGVWSDIRG